MDVSDMHLVHQFAYPFRLSFFSPFTWIWHAFQKWFPHPHQKLDASQDRVTHRFIRVYRHSFSRIAKGRCKPYLLFFSTLSKVVMWVGYQWSFLLDACVFFVSVCILNRALLHQSLKRCAEGNEKQENIGYEVVFFAQTRTQDQLVAPFKFSSTTIHHPKKKTPPLAIYLAGKTFFSY